MISRLELAVLLFNYSPATTPHETLSSVRNAMASAFEKIEELHARIATVNPEAVYEHQGDVFFRERAVQRKTPKRIILEPEFEGDRGKHLSRTQLENGEFVTHNHGEVFVLGASLQRKLEQDAERIKSDVAGLVLTEMEIEEALTRNDELILKWEEWQVFNRYLDIRPPLDSDRVFVGERGAVTARGVRNLCNKYSAFCGFKIHPHLLRHTMAHQFLLDNNNDLVSLAQILGHENLNTTSRYTLRSQKQLGEASDNLSY